MRRSRRFFGLVKRYASGHKKITVAAIILLAILIFVFRPRAPLQIETQKVAKRNLVQVVSVSGSVDAQNKVDLSFLTSGQLVYLGAAKNSMVTSGQLIAQEDSRTVQKNLQTALLNYAEQRNSYDQTISNNNNIASPNDALNQNMRRILQNNQYDLQKAVASVELQDLARQQSMLFSPINGILTRADAQSVGTTATPATIFEIVDPGSLIFSMDVDEADIGKVQAGQPVAVTLDPYPNTLLHLPVDSIDYVSHTTSNGGTAYTVRVKLPGDDIARFRIGINGNADITTAKKENILTIPLSALIDDVYVYVKADKMYKKKKISLGLQNDTDVEVLSGLSEGDEIVLQPSKVPQSLIAKQ